jgi:hypothetical protein
VEDGAYVHFMVFIEGNEQKKLRTEKGHGRRFYFYSLELCTCGLLLMYLFCRLVIAFSLFFLLLQVRCLFLYTLSVLRSCLTFLMILSITYKKNEVIRFWVKMYLFLILFLLKMSHTSGDKRQQH